MFKIYHSALLIEIAAQYHRHSPEYPLNTLLSYGRKRKGYYNNFVECHDQWGSMILDSGTYTKNNNPKKHEYSITFKGYLAFLEDFAKYFDFYFSYDEDFTEDGFDTVNQYYYLKAVEAGFKPVFVIHDWHNKRERDFCLNGKHDIVALGSGELRTATAQELCDTVMPFYEAGVKVHLLGCTDLEKLTAAPVYSCDSTTWERLGGAGYVMFWNPKNPGFNKADKIYCMPHGSRTHMKQHIDSYAYLWDFEDYLYRNFKFTAHDVKGDKSKGKLINRAIVNLHYFRQLEDLIRQEHKRLGFRY